jgi:two-component system, LytTR family, response regulator
MNEPLRAIIVDDEPIARDLLRSMLLEAGGVTVVAECGNAGEAVAAIREAAADVVFLDVEMPGGDGFGVIDTVGIDGMPAIVFVTAYDHYALRAFEVLATDYLLKPFDERRLRNTLDRVTGRSRSAADAAQRTILALIEELRARERYADRLAVDAGRHMIFIPTAEVDWLGASGKYVTVHANGAAYTLREGLTDVTARLDPAEFIRVHRSTVLRIDRIREIHRWFRGDYHFVMADGAKLTSGGSYKKAVEDRLLGSQRPPL